MTALYLFLLFGLFLGGMAVLLFVVHVAFWAVFLPIYVVGAILLSTFFLFWGVSSAPVVLFAIGIVLAYRFGRKSARRHIDA